jgi:hypothetical protein
MTKNIGRKRSKSIYPIGVRSELYKGKLAGDGIVHDSVRSREDDSYIDYTQRVKLGTDYLSDDDIANLSGKVKTYHVSELTKR